MNLSLFLAVNRAGVFLSSSQDSPQKTSPPLFMAFRPDPSLSIVQDISLFVSYNARVHL